MKIVCLGDVYNLLDEMQSKIGNGCKVSISVGPYGILDLDVEWFVNEELLRYRKAYSDQELRYIQDIDFLVDWFCGVAKREYKLATVGEE